MSLRWVPQTQCCSKLLYSVNIRSKSCCVHWTTWTPWCLLTFKTSLITFDLICFFLVHFLFHFIWLVTITFELTYSYVVPHLSLFSILTYWNTLRQSWYAFLHLNCHGCCPNRKRYRCSDVSLLVVTSSTTLWSALIVAWVYMNMLHFQNVLHVLHQRMQHF